MWDTDFIVTVSLFSCSFAEPVTFTQLLTNFIFQIYNTKLVSFYYIYLKTIPQSTIATPNVLGLE